MTSAEYKKQYVPTFEQFTHMINEDDSDERTKAVKAWFYGLNNAAELPDQAIAAKAKALADEIDDKIADKAAGDLRGEEVASDEQVNAAADAVIDEYYDNRDQEDAWEQYIVGRFSL